MSIFSELQEHRAVWRKAHINYYRMCQMHMRSFAQKLAEYLEVPEYYIEHGQDDENPLKLKYVSLREAKRTEVDGEFTYEPMRAGQVSPELIKDQDGSWVVGISVIVDNGVNTWPKDDFYFPIEFSIDNEICTMNIGGEQGRTVRYNISEQKEIQVAFEYIVEWLHMTFDRPASAKRPQSTIGFIRHEKD